MLHTILQVWGGIFYLLNKIFLSFSERSESNKKRWRIASWVVYLIGLPPWVIIFIIERNWIVAALEAGGAPAMVLGLVIAVRGKGKEPKWLDHIALVAIVLGFGYSLYDFGGLHTLTQWLEIGTVAGFLFGTYLLAKENASGYLWFIQMNVANGALMWVEHYPWLVLQQVVSLIFVVDAYLAWKRKHTLVATSN